MREKGVLEKWFDRLVRNKMGGAALSTAGIAVGLATIGAGVPLPAPFGEHVGMIGLALIGSSALLFVCFAIGYGFDDHP